MGHIAIKDDILAQVTELARSRGVPVEQQTEALLIQAMGQVPLGRTARESLSDIARMTPKGVLQTDAVELLRQDRGR